MGRSRTRTSRGLIALLAIVIVLGLFFYFHNVNRTKAAAGKPPAPAPSRETPGAPAIVHADQQLREALIVTQAPTNAPTTAPAQPAFANNANSTPASQPARAVAQIMLSNKPLEDGKAKMDAGGLFSARH